MEHFVAGMVGGWKMERGEREWFVGGWNIIGGGLVDGYRFKVLKGRNDGWLKVESLEERSCG